MPREAGVSKLRRGAGTDLRTPAKAGYNDLPLAQTKLLDEAFKKELAIALSDATCADETSLRETSQRIRAAAAIEALVDNEADIVAWRDFMTKALARAQELLGQ